MRSTLTCKMKRSVRVKEKEMIWEDYIWNIQQDIRTWTAVSNVRCCELSRSEWDGWNKQHEQQRSEASHVGLWECVICFGRRKRKVVINHLYLCEKMYIYLSRKWKVCEKLWWHFTSSQNFEKRKSQQSSLQSLFHSIKSKMNVVRWNASSIGNICIIAQIPSSEIYHCKLSDPQETIL